jgi:hypothetical protein
MRRKRKSKNQFVFETEKKSHFEAGDDVIVGDEINGDSGLEVEHPAEPLHKATAGKKSRAKIKGKLIIGNKKKI